MLVGQVAGPVVLTVEVVGGKGVAKHETCIPHKCWGQLKVNSTDGKLKFVLHYLQTSINQSQLPT